MIVRTMYGGERRFAFAEWGNSEIPSRDDRAGSFSYSGRLITGDVAAGLPAVAAAVLRLSEIVASMPLLVYRGRGGDRQRATGSQQWRLLHEQPNVEQSAVDFVQDVTAAVESHGNAFVQKVKAGGQVVELYAIEPDRVRCYRDRATGEKRFDVWTDGRVSRGLTAAEILHVRGPTWAGGLVGMNPIQVHRHALGNAVAMEEFAGRFFRNDARPGVVIEFPQGVTEGQAKAWARAWDAAHAGLDNKHRTGIVGGGASVTTLPVSLEDAQFIEGQRYGVADVARIFRIPKSWLEEGDIGDTAQEVERVTKFSLLPRFRRIERALAADADLFGQPDPYPEFLADALLRPDTERRYRAYKDARQGSWVTANEIRELENLPPIEGGDEIQQTPVGGYPNPGMREEAALNGKAALDRV